MPKVRPIPVKKLEEALPYLGESYARWILASRRRQITTTLKVKVQTHLDLMAIEGSRRLNKVVYKNDVIELLTAWIFSDPALLEAFLSWAFNGGEDHGYPGEVASQILHDKG